MKNELNFIPYKESLALKELGFNNECFGYYSYFGTQKPFLTSCELGNEIESCTIRRKNFLCKAPLFQQAFRFFRDKKGFTGIITMSNYSNDKYVFDIFEIFNDEIYFEGSDLTDRNNGNKEYNSYEEAELDCLKKLIKIVKKQN